MATTDSLTFKRRSRRDDPFGHKTVELNLDDLLTAYNAHVSKIDQGSVVVAATTVALAVVHANVGSTHSVVVTPTTDPGGRWWISGKSATGFTINLQVAAPVGGVGFDYLVKGA